MTKKTNNDNDNFFIGTHNAKKIMSIKVAHNHNTLYMLVLWQHHRRNYSPCCSALPSRAVRPDAHTTQEKEDATQNTQNYKKSVRFIELCALLSSHS